jgi:hypothetical protein
MRKNNNAASLILKKEPNAAEQVILKIIIHKLYLKILFKKNNIQNS